MKWEVINMKLIYPAIFKEEDIGYSVRIPDLLGCCTQGDTLEESIQMAEDAALGWLLTSLEENEEIPNSSKINELNLEKNEFASLLVLDLSAYSEKYSSRKSVKKTLTIPYWLNERAERLKVNFSKTLQDALIARVIKK